jgi:hypothetical protein
MKKTAKQAREIKLAQLGTIQGGTSVWSSAGNETRSVSELGLTNVEQQS